MLDYLKAYVWSESFKVSFWFRVGSYMQLKRGIVGRMIWLVTKLMYKHIQHKTGIQLPFCTQIGEGLRFFHHDCIIIAQSVRIGKNASIHQGVTIGRVFNGKYEGVPTIGDNVVIFAGAKLLGNIKIGDNVVIGANAVVTKDVPANVVVAGIPAKVISMNSNKCFNEYWGKSFAHEYMVCDDE